MLTFPQDERALALGEKHTNTNTDSEDSCCVVTCSIMTMRLFFLDSVFLQGQTVE